MTERERLIELLSTVPQEFDGSIGIGKVADHLLASGVIVPPCKIGDTVYYLTTVDTEKELNVNEIFCGTVRSFSADESPIPSVSPRNIWVSVKYNNGLFYCHKSKEFGKTVFLTKEDAEKALKERSEGK